MKFGGTSVGSVKSILSLKEIVEAEAGRGPVVVVVSALNGITDKLIATSELAKNGDSHYREEFEAMVTRHHQMIDAIIQDDKKRIDLFNNVDQLFDQLRSIYYGVFLIHDLSEKTQDTIISYGERLSSHIVAAMIKNGIRTQRILDESFRAKGIAAWCDFWGFDVNHDWPWWKKMYQYFLPHVLNHCRVHGLED